MSNRSGTADVGESLPLTAASDGDCVEVYDFEVWDRELQKNVTAPYMATPDAIRRLKGIADLESMRVVDRSAVDDRGFYGVHAQPS